MYECCVELAPCCCGILCILGMVVCGYHKLAEAKVRQCLRLFAGFTAHKNTTGYMILEHSKQELSVVAKDSQIHSETTVFSNKHY